MSTIPCATAHYPPVTSYILDLIALYAYLQLKTIIHFRLYDSNMSHQHSFLFRDMVFTAHTLQQSHFRTSRRSPRNRTFDKSLARLFSGS